MLLVGSLYCHDKVLLGCFSTLPNAHFRIEASKPCITKTFWRVATLEKQHNT